MDISYIMSILPSMLRGASQALEIFVLTLIISLPLGIPIALASISRFKPVRFVAKTYIWIFRGTPLMLQLFFFLYSLPLLIPITLDRLPTAIITFGLNYAAYFAEIYRGGIQSIEAGQYEAAKSLGFSRWKTMRMIIFPQTISRIIPSINNEIITLVKDTSLVYAIGVPELLKAAKDANNRDVDPTSFFIAALIYLLFTFIITMFANWLEAKYSRHNGETV